MSNTPPEARDRVPNRMLFGWASGGAAENLFNGTLGALFVPLFTTAFAMDPVLVGLAVTLPRFVDAILDPVVGHWSDNCRSPMGRRRPFMLFGISVSPLLLLLLWWMPLSLPPMAKAAWIIVLNILFWSIYGFFSLPRAALGYELTDDYHERTRVAAVNMWMSTAITLLTPWTYWLIQRPSLGSEVDAARWVAIVASTLFLLLGLLCVGLSRERFARPARKHPPFLQSLRQTLRLPAFRHLVALRITYTFGSAVWGGMQFYVLVYYVCSGDKGLYGRIGGSVGSGFTLLTLALVPFLPMIGRRIGKRKGLGIGFFCLLLASLATPLLLNPSNPWLILVQGAITVPAAALCNLFIGSFMGDICDLDEIQSGHRREGLYASVAIFISKVEYALVGLVTGVMVKCAGFDPHQSLQDPGVIQRLLWFSLTPPILFSGISFWLACRFPVDQALMDRTRATLTQRRTQPNTP